MTSILIVEFKDTMKKCAEEVDSAAGIRHALQNCQSARVPNLRVCEHPRLWEVAGTRRARRANEQPTVLPSCCRRGLVPPVRHMRGGGKIGLPRNRQVNPAWCGDDSPHLSLSRTAAVFDRP